MSLQLDKHEIKKKEVFIKNAINQITSLLDSEYNFSKETIAYLLLQDDQEIFDLVKSKELPQKVSSIIRVIEDLKTSLKEPIPYILAIQKNKEVAELLKGIIKKHKNGNSKITDFIDRLTINPFSGLVILILVIYFGLYKFVGKFGAGTLVDVIDKKFFLDFINPLINSLVATYIPWKPIQDLLGNDYGIFTLGIRYALAIILPITSTFFLFFSILEDSGYLPRVALLMDSLFKKIGLNGRAVIPMTLGFGCGTMATMVTRTLETKRERLIATLLLALAIPCSAQFGIIFALLSNIPSALFIWAGFVTSIFLLIGYLAAKVLPGSKPLFYMELPPLRLPAPKNVFTKTYSRIYMYLKEIFPLFILASILIWLGNITGIFQLIVSLFNPIVQGLGLPEQMSEVFLFGFFRRDYGAAGLYDLQQSGLLNNVQLLVTASTLTLFVPCIAQFIVMVKERGFKTAAIISGFIFPFAFLCGYILNKILTLLGIRL